MGEKLDQQENQVLWDQKVTEVMLEIEVSLVSLVCQVSLGLLVFLEKWGDLDSKEFKVSPEKWGDLVLKDIKVKLVIVVKREHLGKQVWKDLLDQKEKVEFPESVDLLEFLVKMVNVDLLEAKDHQDHKDHQDLAGYQDNEAFEEETVVKDLQVLKLAKQKFLSFVVKF